MDISPATYADSWGIEELGAQYEDEVVATNPTLFPKGIFDRGRLTCTIVGKMDSEDVTIIVARHNDKVVGFMRATEQPW